MGPERIVARGELDFCLLGHLPRHAIGHLQPIGHQHQVQPCCGLRPPAAQHQGSVADLADIPARGHGLDHLPLRCNLPTSSHSATVLCDGVFIT